jgi:hypothetical protein
MRTSRRAERQLGRLVSFRGLHREGKRFLPAALAPGLAVLATVDPFKDNERLFLGRGNIVIENFRDSGSAFAFSKNFNFSKHTCSAPRGGMVLGGSSGHLGGRSFFREQLLPTIDYRLLDDGCSPASIYFPTVLSGRS